MEFTCTSNYLELIPVHGINLHGKDVHGNHMKNITIDSYWYVFIYTLTATKHFSTWKHILRCNFFIDHLFYKIKAIEYVSLALFKITWAKCHRIDKWDKTVYEIREWEKFYIIFFSFGWWIFAQYKSCWYEYW